MLSRLAASLAALAITTTAAFGTDIIDEGQFFSPAAESAANRAISGLEQKYQHAIHIETYAAPPAKFAGGANRDAMYEAWIKDRAAQTNAKGLFVLISKEPAHVHAAAGKSLVQAGFTSAARQRVVNSLLTSFRAKKFDDGLNSAVVQIGDEFAGMSKSIRIQDRDAVAAPAPRAEQQGGGFGGWLMIGLLIVGGLFLLSLLGRAFSGGAGRAYGAPGMGGGFGTGLFGGILGALAGNWLYDSFSSSHHGQAFGQDHLPTTSGGDDFGSGADFGGDDFGGGDFGGGDF